MLGTGYKNRGAMSVRGVGGWSLGAGRSSGWGVKLEGGVVD